MKYRLDSYFEPVECLDGGDDVVVADTRQAHTKFDRHAGSWVTRYKGDGGWSDGTTRVVWARSWLEACANHRDADPVSRTRFGGEVRLAHALTECVTRGRMYAARWLDDVPDRAVRYFEVSMGLDDAHLVNRVAFVRHGIMEAVEQHADVTSQESIDQQQQYVAIGSITALIRGLSHKTMRRNIIELGDVALCAYVHRMICARFVTPSFSSGTSASLLTIHEGEEE